MATHSSILVWEIPWTEEPGGLQAVGLQRVGHSIATEHVHTPPFSHVLLAAVSLEYHLPSLHFEPVSIFRAGVSLLEAVYSWVLFFNPFSHSVS